MSALYALKGAPREPKILPKSTQGDARAPNWRTFVVKMPLLKASRFLNAFLHVFCAFLRGPTLRIVWYLAVQINFPYFCKKSVFCHFLDPFWHPKC